MSKNWSVAKAVRAGAILGSALILTAVLMADVWNKKTEMTFNETVELPGGVVLPPGDYVFKLADSSSNRHIVQVFNKDEDHIHATILAIPNWRLTPTGKTVITFHETPAGQPKFIRAWFYPGDNSGQEFAYPKDKANYLAKLTGENVPVIPSDEETIAAAETPSSVPSAEEESVERVAEASTPAEPAAPAAPAVSDDLSDNPDESAAAEAQAPSEPEKPEPVKSDSEEAATLPQTASNLPALGLFGLLSLGAVLGIHFVARRRV